MDSKGNEEVDLMDELLDSGENFDELNDVSDDKTNKRRGGRTITSMNFSGNQNDSMKGHTLPHTSSKNGNHAPHKMETGDSKSVVSDQRRRDSDSKLSPKSSKRSLDDLSDEDDLMDYEGSPRGFSPRGTKGDLSISGGSGRSSRASSPEKESDKEEKHDFKSEEPSVKSETALPEKKRVPISMDDVTEKKADDSEDKNNTTSSSGKKKYDYVTKINYMFREARFFLMKSNNEENIELSKDQSVWSTPPQNEAKINQSVKECRNVILIYSVKESGKFCGFARVAGESRRDVPQVNWSLPPGLSARALGGVFTLDWISKKDLSFNKTGHLYNPWNEGKAVKIGRDGQEIEPRVAEELCRLIPKDNNISLTQALLRSKKRAKVLASSGGTKGVIRRPLAMQGSERGRRGFGGGGSMMPFRSRGAYGGRGGYNDRRGGSRGYYVPHRGRPDFISRNRGGNRLAYHNYSHVDAVAEQSFAGSNSGMRRKRYEDEELYEEAPRIKKMRRDEDKMGFSSRGSERSVSPPMRAGVGRRGEAPHSSGSVDYFNSPPPGSKGSAPMSYQDFMNREFSSSSRSSSTLPPMAFPPPPPFAPLSPPRFYEPPPSTSEYSSSSSRSRSADKPHNRGGNVESSYDRSVDEFLLRNRDRRREGSREKRYKERR